MIPIVFGSILPWLLIAIGAWLGYQLVRQNGRILLRLESIEKQLGPRAAPKRPAAAGLPVGAIAPDFELPDLSGARRKLSEFRGQDVLLIFFDPKCGFCTQMAADLAALPTDGVDGRAVPIVITAGDAQENRQLVERYRIGCVVLLQEQREVANLFRAQGTPTGYRIDAKGHIAGELAVGAQPLLLRAAKAPPQPTLPGTSANGTTTQVTRPAKAGTPTTLPGAAANGHAAHGGKGDPSLARSRLNRDGLKAGAPAPDFRLPRIDGGELSLEEYRGRRVLLVFSDPDCGPCDELAPRLQEVHVHRPDLNVLVVGRREPEANRAKAAAMGLTYPIVLQKQWEVSLKYGMFATPIGYLIDERGILASDVAVGVGPILVLVDESVAESQDDASFAPASGRG
jgi:peroxiredoxin